ncbi:MAG: hypothetical protein LBV46_02755 [Bacteroidales bacterium]|jgi:regulator of replication initiation timing|nr:hypothetical protein [Bacteroidales bacterium]
MEPNNTNQVNPLKKWVILLAVIAGVFLITTLYFGFFAKPVYNTEYVKVSEEKESLQAELDSLLAEHDRIKTEYGDLTTQLSEKDSIILANAEEIKQMINSQADYRKIKKQLARLQSIAQDYVSQIDILYTENQNLKTENKTITQKLAKTEEAKTAVEAEKEALNDKLTTAAALKAYNVYSRATYNKSKRTGEVVTEKANRVENIKTTLLLGENTLINPGKVNIYCRIARPGDGQVLAQGQGDAFTFRNNGQKLQYSCVTTVDYKNQATQVTLNWELPLDDHADKGRYIVQVYSDDVYLGESSFELK